MNNDIFKIWMAGFYEGEGSISNDISNNNRLRLSISQNDVTPLEKALKTSTVKLDRKFKCKLCEKEYASPSGRTRHFKSEHINTDTSQ